MKRVFAFLLLALTCLPCRDAGAQIPTGEGGPFYRYLILVDSSSAMGRRKAATAKSLGELIYGGFDGQIQAGDTVGIWTFGQELNPGAFPTFRWAPNLRTTFAAQAVNFIDKLKHSRRSDLDKAVKEAVKATRISKEITIFIFSDGNEVLYGTPYDLDVSTVYLLHREELAAEKKPFVTSLAARGGKIRAWAVDSGGGQVSVPRIEEEKSEPTKPAGPPPGGTTAAKQPIRTSPPPGKPTPPPPVPTTTKNTQAASPSTPPKPATDTAAAKPPPPKPAKPAATPSPTESDAPKKASTPVVNPRTSPMTDVRVNPVAVPTPKPPVTPKPAAQPDAKPTASPTPAPSTRTASPTKPNEAPTVAATPSANPPQTSAQRIKTPPVDAPPKPPVEASSKPAEKVTTPITGVSSPPEPKTDPVRATSPTAKTKPTPDPAATAPAPPAPNPAAAAAIPPVEKTGGILGTLFLALSAGLAAGTIAWLILHRSRSTSAVSLISQSLDREQK